MKKGPKVVGTIRSMKKVTFERNLKAAKLASKISLGKLLKIILSKAFDKALKKHLEVTVFLHTASPFDVNVTDI